MIALSSGLLAAACVVALAIVASVKGAEALATSAIALAIITFIVQLIVYVAQAEQSRRENELTQSLHSQLRTSLADLTARAEGTEATMETINEKVLDKALEQTGSRKLEWEVLPDGFTRDLAQNVAEIIQQSETSPESGSEGDFKTEFPTKSWGPEEDLRVMRVLTTWPTSPGEIATLRESVDGLPAETAFALSRFADDERAYREPDTPIAPMLNAPHGPFGQPLYDRGLIEDTGKSAYGSELTSLTEAGRHAARIFTAEGDPPPEIADLVTELRNKSKDVERGLGDGSSAAGDP